MPGDYFAAATIAQSSANPAQFFTGFGDSIFTRKGERVIWDIHEDVTKVFFSAQG